MAIDGNEYTGVVDTLITVFWVFFSPIHGYFRNTGNIDEELGGVTFPILC